MKRALTLAALLVAVATKYARAEPAPNMFESAVAPTAESPLDQIVLARLTTLGIKPTLCSDAVFVRRAYLDVIGTLPNAREAREFIDDPDVENKRRTLVDRLLERDEFADYWAMKWGDILRIKAEFPVNLWPNAAQAYHRWVRASIAANKPYDQFARELLTSSGSNFRVGPVNFYRAVQNRTPEGITGAVALTLMGSRADGWPEERVKGMAVFFSQIAYKPTSEWKEENVFWDPLRVSALPDSSAPGQDAIRIVVPAPAADAATESATAPPAAPVDAGAPLAAMFPDGTKIELAGDRDPREIFADWLIRPENPWFTRNIANRVWAWLMGRGIIHEPDDIRDDNPPSNPELLAYLEKELINSRYDLKHLYRQILTSETYQLSCVPHAEHPQAEANFASYPLRRLEAEVLIDAINQITGDSDLYTSAIPEPFTYIPQGQPAVTIADGSITSSFLTLFGRSARATGMENERENKTVPAQWLHMLNSSHIQRKLEQGPKLRALFNGSRKAEAMIEDLYLTILSRRPSADELATMKGHFESASSRREAPVDMAWALINSTEFLYRH